MRVLVTGGAGYIGSITAAHLLELGHAVVVLDDLSSGHRAAVPQQADFQPGRLQAPAALLRALSGCDAVLHFAARSLVAESVQKPRLYFEENVGGTLALLDGMRQAGVHKLVFSSSAAVYGNRDLELLDESLPSAPEHPYGLSKAMMENVLREACAGGLAAVALRYFNAAGAHEGRGEDHRPESHLVPRLCAHLLGRLPDFAIHGSDYPTPDGTAIRDYVHVHDLARAHALALDAMRPGELRVLNLGSGRGQSVREMIDAAAKVTGQTIAAARGPRRAGDPARLVASNARAAAVLGWQPERSSAERILADAWQWHRQHPDGYAD